MMERIVAGGADLSYENARRINSNFEEVDGKLSGWEDLRFPASTMNPPGSASDADVTLTGVFIGTLLFAPTGTEICVGQAQMPHAKKLDTLIYPHLHWCPTTSAVGGILWRLEYVIADKDSVFPSTYTVLDTIGTTGGVADMHQRSFFTPIDTVGLGISTMMIWKLSRIGDDALDTYGADVRLLEFDIHYQVDEVGSTDQAHK